MATYQTVEECTGLYKDYKESLSKAFTSYTPHDILEALIKAKEVISLLEDCGVLEDE